MSGRLHTEGLIVVQGAFSRQWAAQFDDDLAGEFMDALRAPRGVAPRGWNRFYFEPYAEKVRGFLDLVTHPVLTALSEEMFGPDWQVVELGCDIPLPGAINQPWHRDFPIPDVTRRERRLTSIAVNVPVMDVVDGPFQAVLGTQFYDSEDLEGGMFPPDAQAAVLEARMQSFYAKMGDFSVRTGLILHRGSAMGIDSRMRQVAILGITAQEDGAVVRRRQDPADPRPPRIRVSQGFYDSLDPELRAHLSHEVVSDTTRTLPPHRTEHTFEGLRMGRRAS
ncbi:phytanoyl-CoA dioxygenase family protein [Georgenia sp. SYP-B2076]|uniref:phytanoyl-CoA dioxygenase family protein n=1 Tax=Georgenia sp. SYP-B2076 TaxID=2495881 RepID=UPI000F8E43B5|nr:phytanoyl-CoA dioxygenase family protein [Georgenia sp. SYP-B2076]